MTVRESMGDAAACVQRRLDEVLDSEDGIIVLVDRHGATTFCHGFGVSGCQLELLGHELDVTLRSISPGDRRAGRDSA